MAQIARIARMLKQHGQEHLLKFFDELTEPRQQTLIADLESIDFAQLDKLIDRYVVNCPPASTPTAIEPAETVSRHEVDVSLQKEIAAAEKRGLELVADIDALGVGDGHLHDLRR